MEDERVRPPRSSLICLLALLLPLTACQVKETTITLAFLGDIMLGRDTEPQPSSFNALSPYLQQADLSLANLESPLTNFPPRISTGIVLCAPPSGADLLAAWNLDMVSTVNNHDLDCGQDGLTETLDSLDSAGITPITEDDPPVFLTLKGIRLAFFAYDDISSPMNIESAAVSIHEAGEQGNLVIVSIHWGNEYQAGASGRQQALAQELAEAGAGIVWGHHPHVLQPASTIHTGHGEGVETAGRDTLVLYSLGNAFFDQHGLDDTKQSAIVFVKVDAHGVREVSSLPFIINSEENRVDLADENTAQEIQQRLGIQEP